MASKIAQLLHRAYGDGIELDRGEFLKRVDDIVGGVSNQLAAKTLVAKYGVNIVQDNTVPAGLLHDGGDIVICDKDWKFVAKIGRTDRDYGVEVGKLGKIAVSKDPVGDLLAEVLRETDSDSSGGGSDSSDEGSDEGSDEIVVKDEEPEDDVMVGEKKAGDGVKEAGTNKADGDKAEDVGGEFLVEDDVVFDAEEYQVNFNSLVSTLGTDVFNLPRAQVLIADLLSGVVTSSQRVQPFAEMLRDENDVAAVLSAPERFVDGHIAAVAPLTCCLAYRYDQDAARFLQQWAGIQGNQNTTYAERWKVTNWLQLPFVRPLPTAGVRATALADVGAYDIGHSAAEGGAVRLLAGDPVACELMTTGGAYSPDLPVFDATAYGTRDLKGDVTVCFNALYTDAAGEVVDHVAGTVESNDAAKVVVRLKVGVTRGGKDIASVTVRHGDPASGVYVFPAAGKTTTKRVLFGSPHVIKVNGLSSLEVVYPVGDEVCVIARDRADQPAATLVDAFDALNRRFSVPFDAVVVAALTAG